MFSQEEFLSGSSEVALDDKFNQLEPGEYQAQVGVDDKAMEIKTGEKDGKPWAQIAVKYEVLDPSGDIEKALGRKPSITQRFFIDLTESGGFDYGKQKNVRFGQLLSATGCNVKGWKPTDVKGKRLTIKVAKQKDQNGEPRSEVVSLGMAQ